MFIFVLNIPASSACNDDHKLSYTQDHSRGVESIPQNRNDSSKDTKHGFGHVTSACDDDHYYAHKIILAAGGQFLKIKKDRWL